MHFTPRVGTKVWFGPRRFGGWGWSPVTWEGWVTSLVFIVGVLVSLFVLEDSSRAAGLLLSTGLLIVVCLLKGTSPGGRGVDDQYRAYQQGQRPPD